MELDDFVKLYRPVISDRLNHRIRDITLIYNELNKTGIAKDLTVEQARVILGGYDLGRICGFGELQKLTEKLQLPS